ncbi:glycine-rich domain-containing protein [Streptomyces phaeochromogenes]|uniref:glycine-rich domain-containing protein n=1 Tax=Streptomyces phaeochromogenes TaxID=1923 RepID=UPI0036776AA6
MTSTTLEHVEIPAAIRDLDLSLIGGKLKDRATEGREATCPPVELDKLDQAIEDYRLFLAMCQKYPGFPIVPSFDIDEVWHQHVLFTEKYREDCQATFGRPFEHVPYFGRVVADKGQDSRIFENTLALWKQEYGQVPASYAGMADLTCSGGWSGTVDLTGNFMSWDEQAKVLRG